MAKMPGNYTTDVEGTDKQFSGGSEPLPHMYSLIWAEAIEIRETKDTKGYEANITFEVQEPEQYKGRKFWANWTILHPQEFQLGAYKYGKPMFDKLGRAVGILIDGDTDTDDLLFKTFVIETGINRGQANPNKPGEFYSDKTQIQKYFYSDAAAKEPVPEIGIIGDGSFAAGTAKKPVAANSNAPSAAASGAKRPWGSKAA